MEFPDPERYEPESDDVVPFFVVLPRLTDPEQIKLAVLAGAGSPMCEQAGWDGSTSARIVLAAWFTGELAPVPGTSFLWDNAQDHVREVWREFRALPADEQATRMAAFRDASLACDGGAAPSLAPR